MIGPVPAALRICATPKCGRKVTARGYCASCYVTARRHGLGLAERIPKVNRRFWVTLAQERWLMAESRRSGRTVSDLLRTILDTAMRQ